MEENNRKGPGVFYAVMGVATLVVAIIGATFAYFSATDTAEEIVEGEAAAAGLSVTLARVSTQANGGLIPIADGTSEKEGYEDSLLDTALNNAGKMCLDKENNTVCQVYKITVKNDGGSTVRLNGTLSLTATGYTNLKWANINAGEGLTTDTTPTTVGTTLNASTVTTITSNEVYTGGQEKYYYIMVYINEIGDPQEELDNGEFTGTVSFNAAGGSGVTATFSN